MITRILGKRRSRTPRPTPLGGGSAVWWDRAQAVAILTFMWTLVLWF